MFPHSHLLSRPDLQNLTATTHTLTNACQRQHHENLLTIYDLPRLLGYIFTMGLKETYYHLEPFVFNIEIFFSSHMLLLNLCSVIHFNELTRVLNRRVNLHQVGASGSEAFSAVLIQKHDLDCNASNKTLLLRVFTQVCHIS